MKVAKNMFLGILVMCCLALVSNSAMAVDRLNNFELKTIEAKKISLTLEEVKTATSLTIKNENGKTILYEQVRKTKHFAKVFNLEALEAGVYKFLITDQQKEVVQPFEIRAGKVMLDEYRRKEFYAPTVKAKQKFIDVGLLNRGLANVELSVMDKAGNVLFEEEFKGMLRIERRYNLKKMERDMYTVKIVTAHKAYYHQIRI